MNGYVAKRTWAGLSCLVLFFSSFACSGGEAHETRLFFGGNVAESENCKVEGKAITQVSEEEWRKFLGWVTTQTGDEGFTVMDAVGHWQGETEATKIMLFIYDPSTIETMRGRIEKIAKQYIKAYCQDSVLKTDMGNFGVARDFINAEKK